MSDETGRTKRIEDAINREVAGALTIHQHGAATFSVVPRSMSELLEFAKLMAISGVCIRPQFRGNPGACLAITLQAMKWGADPFAVANKAFEVNGQLSYESQLIHAIVNASPALAERLRVTFSGVSGQRQCLVVGIIKGEAEGREYLSPKFAEITPKNSPLWKTDPDQQLFYYSTRAWARRWVPEILLGIYAPDELTATDVTPPPRPRREDFAELATPEERPADLVDNDGVVSEEAAAPVPHVEGFQSAAEALPPAAKEAIDPTLREAMRERLVRAEAADAETAAVAVGGKLAAEGAEEAEPPASSAARSDLLDEAPNKRGRYEIEPVMDNGKRDWRAWTIALFLPALRKIENAENMAEFVLDNGLSMEAAKSQLGAEWPESAVRDAWKRVGR